MEKILTAESRSELLRRHRKERDSCVADRIKVVLLRDDGWNFEAIAEALFLSDDGVRQQFNDYIELNGVKHNANCADLAFSRSIEFIANPTINQSIS
jgi:hypothetical protein